MTKPDMFSGVACNVSVQANVKIRKYGRKAVISWSCENPEAIEAIEVIEVIQKYKWPTDPGPVNPITLKNIAVTAGATRSYYVHSAVYRKNQISMRVEKCWEFEKMDEDKQTLPEQNLPGLEHVSYRVTQQERWLLYNTNEYIQTSTLFKGKNT